jgi:hypothetical protein
MTCEPIQIDGKFAGFICSRSRRRPKCVHCKAPATLQCDHKGCDRHICATCSTPGGPDIDYCRDHQADAAQVLLLLE